MLKAALQQDHHDIASMRGDCRAIKKSIAEVLPKVGRYLSLKLF